jgi:ribosomal protein S18 acetylase RimI-like enzyme
MQHPAQSDTVTSVRPMHPGDLPEVLRLQAAAYAMAGFAPESAAVFLDRIAVAPAYCLVAQARGHRLLGYLVSHPWHGDEPPKLDTVLKRLPAHPALWYLHDCAIDEVARGLGIAGALYDCALATAQRGGLRKGALVAVAGAASYWQRRGYRAEPQGAQPLTGYGPGACYMSRALHGAA